MYLINCCLIITLCSLLPIACPVFALDSDSQKKINITADSGTYNFKTGIDTYEGHIRIDQGTTHLTADKLVTKKNKQHQIQEAIAYGLQRQAHYWTTPKPKEPVIHAYARLVRFYPLTSNISLENDVHLTQGKNSFKGDVIHYNNKDQTITVPSSAQSRAVIVYNPNK